MAQPVVVQVAQEHSAADVGRALDKLEKALGEHDVKEADSPLSDVAKAGCNIGSGKTWGFDGKTFDANQRAYVEAAEDKAYAVDRLLTNSEVDRASTEMATYRKVFDKPAFQSDPALKEYFDGLATAEMTSLLSRLAAQRLGNMEYQYTWILDAIKENNLVNVNVHAPRFKQMYYSLRHDGFDTGALKISKNFKDSLADKISLDVALKDVNSAMLTVKAIAAQEKARQAAYLQKWKSLMHGDKARIYAQNGLPTRFENCLPDYPPEAAARSSWWLYYQRQDAYWLWETTYRFNGQGALINTSKVKTFFPQS